VRLTAGAWMDWEMTMEIRQGTLALRLLRPIDPLLQWSADNLAAIPMRGVVAIPVAAILLYVARSELSHDWFSWLLLFPALLGAWLLYFLVQSIIGTFALRFESAASLFDAWLGFRTSSPDTWCHSTSFPAPCAPWRWCCRSGSS